MVDRSEKKHNHSAEQSTIPQNGSSKYPSAERHTHSAEWSIHHLGANIYTMVLFIISTLQSLQATSSEWGPLFQTKTGAGYGYGYG